MEKSNLTFKLPEKRISSRCLKGILLLHLFMLAGTWGFHIIGWQEGSWLKYFLVQLSLAMENVVASWYSSMLLLLASLLFMACFFADRQLLPHRRTWFLNYGWIFLSLIFATLSFDEMGSFHEVIGETVAFNKLGSSLGLGEYAGWTVFVILIGAVGIFMLLFSWFRLKNNPWAMGLFILGVLLFLSNLLQERLEIESFWASQGDSSYRRPAFFLLLEEGSEIFGSLCFIVSGFLYATSATRKSESGLSETEAVKGQGVRGGISLNSSPVIIYTALIICFLGVLMALVEFFPMDISISGDDGIAKNWFPSTVAFLVFLVSLYLISLPESNQQSVKRIYYLLAGVSLVMSAYYGGSFYNIVLWWAYSTSLPMGFSLTIVAAAIFSVFLLMREEMDFWTRFGIGIWALLLFINFAVPDYAAEIGFIAFSGLLISLLAYAGQKQDVLLSDMQLDREHVS